MSSAGRRGPGCGCTGWHHGHRNASRAPPASDSRSRPPSVRSVPDGFSFYDCNRATVLRFGGHVVNEVRPPAVSAVDWSSTVQPLSFCGRWAHSARRAENAVALSDFGGATVYEGATPPGLSLRGWRDAVPAGRNSVKALFPPCTFMTGSPRSRDHLSPPDASRRRVIAGFGSESAPRHRGAGVAWVLPSNPR
jgi:hypothetical protein